MVQGFSRIDQKIGGLFDIIYIIYIITGTWWLRSLWSSLIYHMFRSQFWYKIKTLQNNLPFRAVPSHPLTLPSVTGSFAGAVNQSCIASLQAEEFTKAPKVEFKLTTSGQKSPDLWLNPMVGWLNPMVGWLNPMVGWVKGSKWFEKWVVKPISTWADPVKNKHLNRDSGHALWTGTSCTQKKHLGLKHFPT